MDVDIKTIQAAYDQLANTKGPEDRATLEVLLILASKYYELQDAENAKLTYGECYDKSLRIFGPTDELTLAALEGLAIQSYDIGELWDALKYNEESYERSLQAFGNKDIRTLRAVKRVGDTYRRLGYDDPAGFDNAELFYKHCYKAMKEVLGENNEETIETLVAIAELYFDSNNYKKAEPLAREAWEKLREIYGADDPYTLHIMDLYGEVLSRSGKIAQAREVLAECFKIRLTAFGENHPRTLSTMHNLSITYANDSPIGDYAAAKDLDTKRLEILRRIGNDSDPLLITTILTLAGDHMHFEEFEEALHLYEEADDIRKRIYGDNEFWSEIIRDGIKSCKEKIATTKR